MNDIQFFEASRAFAQRVLTTTPSTPDRLTTLFRSATGRQPDPSELTILEQALSKHLTNFKTQPEAAQQAITYGESKPDPALNPSELAAWTLLANLILNLDEVVTKS